MDEGLKEHRRKYEALAQEVGITKLQNRVRGRWTLRVLRKAYDLDPHLNNLGGNEPWDVLGRDLWWRRDGKKYHSLAERVCVLKHVAITRVLGLELDFEGGPEREVQTHEVSRGS